MSREFHLDHGQWATILNRAGKPATFGEVVGEVEADDTVDTDAEQFVEAAIDAGDLVENPAGMFGAIELPDSEEITNENGETANSANSTNSTGERAVFPEANPGNTTETPEQNDVDREDAVAALRDVLQFDTVRLDDTITDHTENGDHPERPTTAREYFTEVRGWENDTVDDLLLGWAPDDHVDELVAYLFDRGHSREAMIATGALGEKDTGGLYATFSARYVLPYFDANGEPAYAIARCTGGDGGGAKGYGGHPGDWKAGKYAKLRHTDERVPFDEPIYGLDTVTEGEHVVVAEGIADAITAREAGYAVLSPVAKEFKEAHYDPLAKALDDHHVDRVTIVGDADSIRNASEDEVEPDSIREAVGVSLSPTGAGLAGALRTATKLGGRTDADVRVTLPPAPADTKSDLDEFVTGDWAGDLDALLRSAKPVEAFDELDTVTSTTAEPTERFDEFDPEEYEPTATEADETTDDIRDVFAALDRLDAQRVADRTIVSEWLESSTATNRTFAPSWAPSEYSGTAVYCDSDKFVDTGDRSGKGGPAVMAAIDAGLVRDTQCPDAVSGETWFDAVDHLRELGFSIPKLETASDGDEADSNEYTETGRDLLGLDVVVEPSNALAAAAAVEPDDLIKELPQLEREDVDDVAIAVALAEGVIADAGDFPTDGDYTDAYYRAHDHYGAPLPKYLDNSTLEQREDLVFAALERVRADHVLDSIQSEITVDEPSGKALAKINPTWEESESGERILAGYGRGFWCVEHEVSFSPIQLVALEHELTDTESDYPRGEAFKQAYRLLREEYSAPLPKWRATLLEHVAVLPPSVRVMQGSASTTCLGDVHDETEALIRDTFGVRDRAQLVTNAPNTGKTFSTAKAAADRPILYLAQRNQLKDQMANYAREIRESGEFDAEPTAHHLPILASKQVDEAVLLDAVGGVRERGRALLRDRAELLDLVGGYLGEEFDEEGDTDKDDVDLDRATCPVASGDHGNAWALAVQTARALGHTPADIHKNDRSLFGEELPCQEVGNCPYTEAWDSLRKPDNQYDILIGSPGHAQVDTATTFFERDRDGDRVESPRVNVLDEFPGDAYIQSYGDRAADHAVWLAESLVGVDNREDLLAAGLDGDTWVECWLDGDGDEVGDADDVRELLGAAAGLTESVEKAEELVSDGITATLATANLPAVEDALETLADSGDDTDLRDVEATLDNAVTQLEADADRAYAGGDRDDAGELYALVESLTEILDGVTDAARATDNGHAIEPQLREAIGELPVDGDLRALLDDTIEAIGDSHAESILKAAQRALRGGREGCKTLAIHADDGYAHPDAWALFAGMIATDGDEVETANFAFDGDEGGRFKRLQRNGATIVADKNHHGMIVVDPPKFTDINGGKCPVVGLDATGRTELWRIAIGRDTQQRDIHKTDTERRRFLREVMQLRIIQTSNRPLPYHGNPDGKNFGEDIELVRTVAEEYDKPAVISTQKVVEHLEDDLNEHTTELINYENMKGSDAIGDRQVAVILGSCHFSDAVPEKWALLAGEDADRGETRGERLDYGSEVANAYLKHMRQDYTMQAILRAGRNDDTTVVFAHTSALRDDLPVEDEGAVLSVHSKGTLAVSQAASNYTNRAFTAQEIADDIGDDSVGLRQVQNIVADLRQSGYLRVKKEGSPGVAYEYEVDEDPGLADVELPTSYLAEGETYEKSHIEEQYMWNFVSQSDELGDSGLIKPPTAKIPATEATEAVANDPPPK